MFVDLDFNDDESFNDSKYKPDFTATQLMEFNNKKRNELIKPNSIKKN
jgi:hypothetical protein